MPQFRKDLPRIDALLSNATPLCPIGSCDGRMQLGSGLERLGDMGLQRMACRICRHRGFRALEGVQVLFGGRHEHVCEYGPSSSVLTVIFSEAALSLILDAYLSPTDAARYAEYWASLRGHMAGQAKLIADPPQVSEWYGHFCREYDGLSRNSDEGDCKHDYQLDTVRVSTVLSGQHPTVDSESALADNKNVDKG